MTTRRDFVRALGIAGAAGILGGPSLSAGAEAPPETTRIRLSQIPGICVAPQYVAEDLLRAEGFTSVEYVKFSDTVPYPAFAAGTVDVSMAFVAPFIRQVDNGSPIVLLGGVHVGCYEVFGTERVRAIRDLRDKTVAVPSLESPHYLFLATMAAHVGLDPYKHIKWVTHPAEESIRLLQDGKIDALVAFPPFPQEIRARKIGHLVVSSALDRPWSQYFCCILAANRDFVARHPVATKRALRAILKATDICALEPDRAAQVLIDRGFTKQWEYARQTMREVPYNRWREFDPEDTVRFYALRLHEVGMIKASPQKIIAQGTNWRFLNELKKELKG
jgi:NitT/TauT family transport system substrate-binding protein